MSDIKQISDIITAHKQTIYDRCGKLPEFPLTSLPQINKKIWGFKRQKMVVVGARPGNGKSLFMLQLAYDFALQGKTVYFFSFEMSMEVCSERIIANRCEIDNFILTTGEVGKLSKCKEGIDKLCAESADFNLHIFDSIGRTLPKLNGLLNMVNGKPDIVFIDYGNLVEDQRGKTKKETYDEYIKGLRALALKNNFCVVMGAQINRQVAFKGFVREPILEDLKDTGELEQTADMVILLHYPFHHSNEDEDRGKFVVKVAKNRDGRTGRVNCRIIPEHYKIVEEDETNTKPKVQTTSFSERACRS